MSGIKSIDKLKSVLDDKYEIVGLIASGGMGEIYLGIHRVLGKKRAIKVIHQEVEKEKDIRKRFIQEARLAASIDHPGIIGIMDFGSHDAFDYLIMPYIEGVSLQDKLDDGVMKWEDAIDLMISMADAISHAHKKNIIHRDIKPANYMIDVNGQIILTDFGISKNLTDVTLTAANTILGSPKFMSPEQITGKKVDERSDLYSLGLVFYQMLTGVNPFDAEEITSVMYKQVHEIPDHPSVINSSIPKKVGDVLSRLLEKNPDDRYPDADALLSDLYQLKNLPADDAGGETVLQIPGARRLQKPQDAGLPDSFQDGSVPGQPDAATRIITPSEKKEIRNRKKTGTDDSLPQKPKKKKVAVGIAAAGFLFLCLLALIVVFPVDFFKDVFEETAGIEKKSVRPEPAALTDLSSDIQPSASGSKVPVIQPNPEPVAEVPKIRIEPAVISETLEKDAFVVKTVYIYNDTDDRLSDIRIETESDGDFDFVGPVSNRLLDVGAGERASFDCPVNSANASPGEVRTGKIRIYAGDHQNDPEIVEITLHVRETAKTQTATMSARDKTTRMAKPEKPMAALRPKKNRETAFLDNFKKLDTRRVNRQDIEELLKPVVGFAYNGAMDRQVPASMLKFLKNLSYVRSAEGSPCDILISHAADASGEKFVFQSNFYDCGDRCLEAGLAGTGEIPFETLTSIIKRYYCYNALIGLGLINSHAGGGPMKLELSGKNDNILYTGEEVRMCVTPGFSADCMLLDINMDGIYKLFPIFEDQQAKQGIGETRCSIGINVSPPAGFEMIAAIGVQNEELLSTFRNRFNPENPIVLWPFATGSEDSAMNFCDEVFLRLIEEPPEKWGITSHFIQIIHKN